MKRVELLAIDRAGGVALPDPLLPETLRQNCAATADYYRVIGFKPPWIGYVSMAGGEPVGGGAFKGAPRDNRVEIAYYTLPDREGRGWATATARKLLAIGRAHAPAVVIAAQTLPQRNASTAILEKLGFRWHGALMHPEDGEVWEWRLAPAP